MGFSPIAMEYTKKILLLAVAAVFLSWNLCAQVIPGSTLADANDNQVLKEWLGESAAGKLLYRKSVDGATSSKFHELCDNQGPTLVLIEASNGTVFGGYASESWSSSGNHKSAPGSFLFNLTTDKKGDLINLSYGIYNNSGYGPTFGGGFDLYLNSSLSGGYIRNSSYASLDGSPEGSVEANKALVGDDANSSIYMFPNEFIKEVEVYGIYNSSEPKIVAQDVIIQLDENGQATLSAEQVDNGTSDPDGLLTLSINKTSFNCGDLAGGSQAVQEITSVGERSQLTHSYGGGYNPNVNEFLYPEWSGSLIHRYNSSGEYLGSFNSGQTGIMQLWMDQDSEDYYTANWSSKTITRRNFSGNVWTYNLNNFAGGVATDDSYVYAIENGGNQVVVLKRSTGKFVKTIDLPGTISIFGGLVVANEKLYLAGNADFGTLSSTWRAIHIIDAGTGEYYGSASTAISSNNGVAFDGENIWLSNGDNSVYGYKISEGNAYVKNGIHNVTLTAIDTEGNLATETVKVTVEDNSALAISLLGDEIIKVFFGEEFTDPGAVASDNCSATVITGGDDVDVNTPGTYIIIYSAVDNSGNKSQEITRTVEVISGDSPPTALSQDITVELDENGKVVISPDQVDNGSSDNEGNITMELDITAFDCSAVGNPQTVVLTVTDETGNSASASAIVTVEDNIAPVVATNHITVMLNQEGVATVSASAVDDSSYDACGIASAILDRTDFSCEDVGENTVTLTVTDNNGNESTGTATVTVINDEPVIDAISIAEGPVQVGVPVTASASFTDSNARSANWYWGDGAVTKGEISEDNFTGTHIYEVPGIYTVTAEVTDICGQTESKEYHYIIVTDPDAGFVTGGGVISSPAGAYTANPSLTGKAQYEFVVKYKKDGSAPKGNMNFRFKPANLKLSGTSFDWLVIYANKAFFKGKGVLSGNKNVEFIVAMVEGQTKNDPAKFRIRILDATDGSVIYDNQVADGIDAVAAHDVSSGAIQIHNRGNSKNARIASDESGRAEIHMFPNPVVEQLNISVSNTENDHVTYRVIDLKGNILINYTGEKTVTLDVDHLNGGMYLLIIETNQQIIRERFMKIN